MCQSGEQVPKCFRAPLLLCLRADFVHRARRSKVLEKAGKRRRIMQAGWSLTGLVVLGWTPPVAAQPTARMALNWNGPPGCPSTETVQARVDALLGGDASASSVADVRASGQIERVESGFRLMLTMSVGKNPSSRVIEARTCDELAGAAAIAIALLARSTLREAPDPSPSETSPAASPVSTPDRQENAPSKATTHGTRDAAGSKVADSVAPSSARARLVLDAPIGLVGWGSLPSAGLGVGAGLGIRWKALRASVTAELWQPQTHLVSGFGAHFTLQSGRTEACLIQAVYGLELAPCLGVALQRLAGSGVGSEVLSAKSRSYLWVSGEAGLFASLPTPGFAHLRFFGEAVVLVSPLRPRFVIDQLGPVHQPALAAPRLDLGCEWIF